MCAHNFEKETSNKYNYENSRRNAGSLSGMKDFYSENALIGDNIFYLQVDTAHEASGEFLRCFNDKVYYLKKQ